jgi:hypothetical protein
VNVCGADELLNVLTIAERPCAGFLVLVTIAAVAPPPETVIVIVPVNAALGVIVNAPETLLISPPAGPVSVYPVAGMVIGFDAALAALTPCALVAVTVQV